MRETPHAGRAEVRPAQPSQRASKRRVTARWVHYSFVLPAALFLLVFIAYPVLFNLRMSFQDVRAANLLNGGAAWVGLDNYRTILANPVFQQAVRNTLLFTGGSVVFQLSLGLLLALFYNLTFPGSRVMRGLYLIAWTIPVIVVAAIFRWLFDGQVGVINYWLQNLSLIDDNVFWFSDPNVALGAIVFINIWLGIPFNMALLLAGLQGIPKEFYEAAEIDGASVPQRFAFITFPLLRPALFAVLLLGLIYTFKVFDVVWATTQGGPFNTTHLVATLAFRTIFGQFQFGTGAAMLNLLFVVLFAVSLLYLWTLRNEEVN